MMATKWTAWGCALALGLCAISGARAADTEDNPMYKMWAKFKPGSSSTLRQETETMGQKMATEMTQTLVEVKPDELTIEIKTTTIMADGKKMEMPAMKTPIKAKIPKTDAKPEGKETKEPEGKSKVTEGTEEIEAAGKKFKCKTTDMSYTQGKNTTTTKTWISDDVPGGTVKMEMKGEGEMKMTMKGTLIAVTIK